jgi:hypothetical protein
MDRHTVVPHPWRALRHLEYIAVDWRSDMPSGLHATTDGRSIIWMRTGLLQVERRCALQHELVHLHYGHTCRLGRREEAHVRRLTAHFLIPTRAFFDAGRWALSVEDWADALWVTPAVLYDRIDTLTPDEQRAALRLIEEARENGAT